MVSCGDNNIRTTAHSHSLLKQIEQYDKHLGSLAYIPSALVKWLRVLNCWKNNQQLVDALTQIQLLLVKRAHEAWIERCKVFEEQWRERCKQVKEREAQAKEAAAKAKAEAAKSSERRRRTQTTKRATDASAERTTAATAHQWIYAVARCARKQRTGVEQKRRNNDKTTTNNRKFC